MIAGMRCALLFLALSTTAAHAQITPGTPVKVMLLRDISSTTSRIGDLVPMVVTEDVRCDSKVVISEGTMAFAKVKSCRREGALSATLFDKPARLCLSLEHMRDDGGREVKLVPKPGKSGELQIVREMTVRAPRAEARDIEAAWENTTTRPVMDKVRRLFSDQAVTFSKGEAETLIEHNVPMPIVQQAIRAGAFDQVLGFIADLKHGRVLEALLSVTPVTRPALICVRAVRELGRLSGGIGNYINGRFKGRNIRCSAGVELIVYTG
jgi:hypothetical protein